MRVRSTSRSSAVPILPLVRSSNYVTLGARVHDEVQNRTAKVERLGLAEIVRGTHHEHTGERLAKVLSEVFAVSGY